MDLNELKEQTGLSKGIRICPMIMSIALLALSYHSLKSIPFLVKTGMFSIDTR